MQRIIYSKAFKWAVWILLLGAIFTMIWVLVKDWQTYKIIRSLRNIQSDHVAQTKIFSLDQKGHPYVISAEKLQAELSSNILSPIYYSLLKPRAVLNTSRYRFQIDSDGGFFFPTRSLELLKNVVLHNKAPEVFYKLITQSACVDFKSQKIFGTDQVSGHCSYGTFSGKSFMIDKKEKILTVKGPCRIQFSGYNKARTLPYVKQTSS